MLKKSQLQKSIKEIQQKLNKNGYKIVVDNILGPETREAISLFQKNNHIEVSGEPTESTIQLLFSDTSVGKTFQLGLDNIEKEYTNLYYKYSQKISDLEKLVSYKQSLQATSKVVINIIDWALSAYSDFTKASDKLAWEAHRYNLSRGTVKNEASNFVDTKILTQYSQTKEKIDLLRDRLVTNLKSFNQSEMGSQNQQLAQKINSTIGIA